MSCGRLTAGKPARACHQAAAIAAALFGLALRGLLLHEPVAWAMIAASALVVICIAFAWRFA